MRYTTAGSSIILILMLHMGLLKNNMDLGILSIFVCKHNCSVEWIIIIKSYIVT